MKRKDNESYISYIKRVTNECENGNLNYDQWGDAILGIDNAYSSENLRKAFYFVKKMLKNIDEDVCEEDVRLELEQLRDEVYKERVRLQDTQREKRKDLREEARFENLLEVLSDFTSDIKINDYKPIEKGVNRKYAILQLSDWHCGAVIDNPFNYYDIDTMTDRATLIRDKAIDNCIKHNVTDLVIEINGDMVDGLIHISSRVEQEEGVIMQTMIVTDILTQLINSMRPYFNSIKVVTTLGNHGRLTASKSDSITKENFEMIIPWGLRKGFNDITVIDSKGLDFVQYEVDGKTIMLSHGQNDKISNTVDCFTKMYKKLPDEIHLGHTHSYKDINDCDVMITVNGCLDGSDDYALTIRKLTVPSQNLIIYDTDRCIYRLTAE